MAGLRRGTKKKAARGKSSAKAAKKAGSKKKTAKKKMAKLGAGKKLWDRAATELMKDGYQEMEVKAKQKVWGEFETAMHKHLGEKVKVMVKPSEPEQE